MAGFYGIFLIIALVIVSGVIAYIGDIVGRRMGRKRLSLFGLRPRHTAIAISVVSGMLITIFTLGAALLLNENVRLGFLRVDALRTELRGLRAERGRLAAETESLAARAEELERQRTKADAEIARQHGELKDTKADLKSAKDELKSEQEKLSAARAQSKKAQALALKYSREALSQERLANQLRRVGLQWYRSAQQARTSPVILEAQQPLDVMVIEPGLTQPQVRNRLETLVARLDRAVRAVGAAPAPGAERAVEIEHAVIRDPKTKQDAWMPAQQVLDELAKGIRSGNAKNGVVVRAICLRNSYQSYPVPVDFEPFRNDLVFAKGSKLGDVVIGEGLPDDEIYDALVLLLREQVGPRGKGRVMPLLKPGSLASYSRGREYVGDISSRELFATIEQIKQIQGRAHVVAVAKEDIWTVGPLKVELRAEPI